MSKKLWLTLQDFDYQHKTIPPFAVNKSFGKNFIIIAFLSSVPLACATDPATVIEYAHRQAQEAELALDEKAKTCDSKRDVSASAVRDRLPVLDKRVLARAIGFLVYRNFVECVYPEEARLLYALHNLEQLAKPDSVESKYAITRMCAIGNTRLINLESEYMALPENTRKQLESIEEFQDLNHPAKLLEELGLLKD